MAEYQFIADPLIDNLVMDYKEDYLRRTIQVKDKNIDDLLKQLKETQDLYQGYKTQYLAEQKQMKAKLSELTACLAKEKQELDQQKQVFQTVKGDLHAACEREQRLKEMHLKESKEQNILMQGMQDRCRALVKENADQKAKHQGMMAKYGKIQQRLVTSQRGEGEYREEVRRLREEMLMKSGQWVIEKSELMDRISQGEQRKKHRNQVNLKLDRIEQKIIDNIGKI